MVFFLVLHGIFIGKVLTSNVWLIYAAPSSFLGNITRWKPLSLPSSIDPGQTNVNRFDERKQPGFFQDLH